MLRVSSKYLLAMTANDNAKNTVNSIQPENRKKDEASSY